MDFFYTAPQTKAEEFFGGHFCVNAVGKVNPGDDLKFEKFLKTAEVPPRCVVYIDSAGGDVETAIKIGRTIRDAWFSTDIGRYHLNLENASNAPTVSRTKQRGECLSAATLIYLGGRLRYMDEKARFGVHQFKFPSAQGAEVPSHFLAKSQTLSAKISEYIFDMGISAQFLLLSAETPSENMRFISKDELERIGVVTGGDTGVAWTLEAHNGLSYVKGERDSIYGHHKVMLCYKKGVGFAFWAVIETQNRAEELLNFRVVEIVVNGEDVRLDISSRAERGEFGIYVNVFSLISQEEAKVLAFSKSFGVQIRHSSNAELFLGIASMETEKGEMKLKTFFENYQI